MKCKTFSSFFYFKSVNFRISAKQHCIAMRKTTVVYVLIKDAHNLKNNHDP